MSEPNVFQNSDFAQSEDLVIMLDNSPAFYTSDISPNRFVKFTSLLNKFIEDRLKIDYRDRYYLVVFNKEISTPMNDYDNFSKSLIDNLNKGFEKTESVTNVEGSLWASYFLKALQKAIQKCIASFKLIRNKTLRIIIFTNQIQKFEKNFVEKIQQIVERTAQRLDIIIDIMYITGSKTFNLLDLENPFKFACDLTGGTYFRIKNAFEFEEAFKKITEKKKILRKSYLGARGYTQEKQFLEVIASDLERITEMLDESELKCQICFKRECSCDLEDNYEHLRRCPNCNKIYHMCCAGHWAEQQNSKSNFIGFPNVFRCPYCFFLLKVPRELVNFDTILHQLQEKWIKQKEKDEIEQKAEQQREKEITSYLNEVETKLSEKERIIEWLTERLGDRKSNRDIERIADDIVNLKDMEEKESFIRYLKFKENLTDDDSLPF